MPGIFVTARDVCTMAGWKYHWFSRNKTGLMRHYGFPQPAAMPGHPKWTRQDVQAWLIRQTETAQPEDATDWDSILDQRFAKQRAARADKAGAAR